MVTRREGSSRDDLPNDAHVKVLPHISSYEGLEGTLSISALSKAQ
jgi:hypothetical protein